VNKPQTGRPKGLPTVAFWDRLTCAGYQRELNQKIAARFHETPTLGSVVGIETMLREEQVRLRSQKPGRLSRFVGALLSDPISLEEKEACVEEALRFCDLVNRASGLLTLYQLANFSWPSFKSRFSVLFPSTMLESLAALQNASGTIDRALESTAPLNQTETLWEVSEQIVFLTRSQHALRELGDGFGPLLGQLVSHFADVVQEESERHRQEKKRTPIQNPYVIGNPVSSPLFVGREDVMRRLEDLWSHPGQCPSVLIYGQRRMGKSSVLQNLSRLRLPKKTVLVDFNLQRVGRVRSTGELLHAIALKLYDAARHSGHEPFGDVAEPSEADFLAEAKNPYLSLDRFLDRLGTFCDGHRFLLAVDEFELLEEQIDAGRIDAQFLSFLRATVQTYSWLVVALAGLHRLEELRHDYWNPLFGSVTAIEVGFLSEKAARLLITSPTPDFALDYESGAIARMYELTHGQPYLIQLICHSLVSRFNRQLAEDVVPPPRRFDVQDVETVVAEPEFFQDGARYFEGVLQHANRCEPKGQVEVLRVCAPHVEGLPAEHIATEVAQKRGGKGEEEMNVDIALQTLCRHKVLRRENGRFRFAVELFRQWLLSQRTKTESHRDT